MIAVPMLTAISHEDVVRVAKEVFLGLTNEHISINGPNPDTGWCITVRFGNILGFKVSRAAGSLSASGKGDHGVDVPLASLSNEAELCRFLTECRDSLAKNLEAMLTVALGPVRVLPKDETVDGMTVAELVGSEPCAAGTFRAQTVIVSYLAEVAKRRRGL